MRSTLAPWNSAVTAASSATGRSEVPAAAIAIRPGSGSAALGLDREAARRLVKPGLRLAAATRAWTSAVVRVTSTRWPRAAMRSTIATICSGVLPAPKMASGKPRRSARWWSSFAKPRSS